MHESMDTWLNDTEAIILLRNICNFAFKQIFHNMWDHWNTNVAIILQQSQIFIYIFFIVFVSCPLFGSGFYILRNILHIYFICIYCMNIYCIYSYSLREINGKRFICDYVPGSTLVTSSGDGLWETHLRDNCNEYLNEINPLELYQYWQQWCQDDHQNPNLVTILCRNEAGKLRDCRSMDEMIKFELPSKNYQANVKLKVEFGC
ncbi:PREDICTED: uncharacterized protein LOC106785817 [Polistes canadensis]|uniref:uncharacterized protein LOC106785817 n=1 Tax=Polistes canadensis TaxID=91411 RepID=UPI000718D938|nr:PREDICTED: uncharacterized protein LOC106785817 [Polistes canadensis]